MDECKHINVQVLKTAERFKDVFVTKCPMNPTSGKVFENDFHKCDSHKHEIIFQRASCQCCFEDFIFVEKTEYCFSNKSKFLTKEQTFIRSSDTIFFDKMKPGECYHPTTAYDILEETFTATKPPKSSSSHSLNTDLRHRNNNLSNTKVEVEVEVEVKHNNTLGHGLGNEKKKEAMLYAHANCRLCGVKLVVENKCTLREINGEIRDQWAKWKFSV